MEDKVIEKLSPVQLLDKIWSRLSDMQAAIFVLFMCGYTESEIVNHFEVSRQRVNDLKVRARKLMEELENERTN